MTEHQKLTPQVLSARRAAAEHMNCQVMFAVKALYGLSRQSVRMPLNEEEAIDSGQICLTIDPDADAGGNVGAVDFEKKSMRVRYGAHIVFPGLHRLVTEQKFDASLLDPVRVTATDECSVTEDFSGWHATGCLEFLPGSPWAGARGG